jgi:hypothetical protein
MAPRSFPLFDSPDCFLCKLPLNEALNFCTNCGVQVMKGDPNPITVYGWFAVHG